MSVCAQEMRLGNREFSEHLWVLEHMDLALSRIG
jgi:hypothetical protein